MPSRVDINSFIHELEPGNEWELPAAHSHAFVSMNMSTPNKKCGSSMGYYLVILTFEQFLYVSYGWCQWFRS